MASTIPTLSPPEVAKAFLCPGHPLAKRIDATQVFHIQPIEALNGFIQLPNPPFRNTDHGFIFVQKGQLDIQINTQTYQLKTNHFILTPANQINCILSILPDTKGFMGTFQDVLLHQPGAPAPIEFEQMLHPGQLPLFQIKSPLAKTFAVICERLLAIYSAEAPSSILIQHYFLSMLSELSQLYQSQSIAKPSPHQRLIADFKQLLFKQAQSNPKPADLARQLHMSVNHLNKILKQYTQLSTSAWIARYQITEAQILLKHTDLSVSEIAYQLGFNDPSYFSKFFYRHTEQSPSTYRKD